MSSLNKTPHYDLSQFGDSPDDKPSWRGDHTADMSRIDAQMYGNATDITAAVTSGVTTLTAIQLDPRYLDDYNSIRAGKPTDSTESEEPHHE